VAEARDTCAIALREENGNLSEDSRKSCKASFNASLWMDSQSPLGAQLPGYCAPLPPLRIRYISNRHQPRTFSATVQTETRPRPPDRWWSRPSKVGHTLHVDLIFLFLSISEQFSYGLFNVRGDGRHSKPLSLIHLNMVDERCAVE
jgi:hypothetical protein